MFRGLVLLFAGSVIAHVSAQPAAPRMYIASADIDKVTAAVKAPSDRPWVGQTVRVVDVGDYNIGVTMIQRKRPEEDALVHNKLTEIYKMIEGAGTLVTGGSLINQGPPSAEVLRLAGPGFSGSGIKGGTTQRMAQGDVVIIPGGVPHMFTALEGPITYMILRVDPDRVLKLQ